MALVVYHNRVNPMNLIWMFGIARRSFDRRLFDRRLRARTAMIPAERKYAAMPAWKMYCRMNAVLSDLRKLSLKLANANFNLHYGIDNDIDNHSEKNGVTPYLRSVCVDVIVNSVAWVTLAASVYSKEPDYAVGKT